jgi:hypothetical protein
MIEFDDLNRLLRLSRAEVGAAECHGFLCGQVCVATQPDSDLWQEFLDSQCDDEAVLSSCREEIAQLASEIEVQLEDTEFGFRLLLPGDDSPFAARVQALADWCQGFLRGVAAVDSDQREPLSADSVEWLDDLGRIGDVDADGEDATGEEALLEIEEYVRIGAQTIFEETRQRRALAGFNPETMH